MHRNARVPAPPRPLSRNHTVSGWRSRTFTPTRSISRQVTSYHDEIIDLYGYNVQASAAIGQWHAFLKRQIRAARSKRRSTFLFGRGDPANPAATCHYRKTGGDPAAASEQAGAISLAHRRAGVVRVAVAWEVYRTRIAHECGRDDQDLSSDLRMDLTRYRNAIAHRGGKLSHQPKALPFVRKGEPITLTDDQLHTIFGQLIVELNRIGNNCYGTEPRFTFDQRLNP